jgi:ATP-dependent exoDNAse (exonuclease V) beta subunit
MNYLSTMSSGNLLVLKSSAGSGKTYALVKAYLRLCLSSDSPSYYSHILAITFTNMAAAEMKERVLGRLKEFSSPQHLQKGDRYLFDTLCSELKVNPEVLHHRAAQTLSHMLHHYSRLGISTIDSFMHRVIRSFARDLRIHPDFAIEMDMQAFREEVVRECLNSLEENPELSNYVLNFILYRMESSGKWNIEKALLDFSDHLIKEKSQPFLAQIQHLRTADFLPIIERIREQHEGVLKPLIDAASRAIDAIKSIGIENGSLYNGGSGTYTFFTKLLQNGFENLPGVKFSQANEKNWISGKEKQPGDHEKIRTILPILVESTDFCLSYCTPQKLREVRILDSLKKEIYAIGLLHQLQKKAQEIKDDQNLLLISDFQKIVSDVVKSSPAPFIFEKAGERYHHILFDEFQDTSEMQFGNFIPLIENALSTGQFNLIVGDAKQAIYRWRNGNAEQFIHLPKVPAEGHAGRLALFSEAYIEDQLLDNRRSFEEIVHFNNRLYKTLSSSSALFQDTYASLEQRPHKQEKGFLSIKDLNEQTTATAAKKSSAEKQEDYLREITNCVKECLADGFLPGDIAVLTRKGKQEGGLIAAHLIEQGYRVVTKESFLLQNSSAVRLVMATLHYLVDHKHSFSRFEIIRQSCELFPSRFQLADYIEHHGSKVRMRTEDFLHDHFPALTHLNILYQNGYSLAENMIVGFGLYTDAYLEFLLDHLNTLCSDKGKQIHELLEWWDDKKDTLYIAGSADPQCIQIMTIHKSKGLQFPVVIVPRFNSQPPRDQIWVEVDSIKYPIPFTIVSVNDINSTIFPEVAEEKTRLKLDDLNLSYVATTRAEERMYLVVDTNSKDAISAAISEYGVTHGILEDGRFLVGERTLKTKQTKDVGSDQLEPVAPLKEKHALGFRVKKFRNDAQEWGEIVHAALSYLLLPSDLPLAVEKTSAEWNLNQAHQKKMLQSTLENILSHSEFHRWFSGKTTFAEREIILENGRIIRPDRIMINDNSIDVIDFKTGETDTAHHEQVREYMMAVRPIFEQPVKGYIAYTQSLHVEEVHF